MCDLIEEYGRHRARLPAPQGVDGHVGEDPPAGWHPKSVRAAHQVGKATDHRLPNVPALDRLGGLGLLVGGSAIPASSTTGGGVGSSPVTTAT
jgi:hypothetical protein